MKPFTLFTFLIFLLLSSCAQSDKQLFTVASEPWEEALGNHRAVLEVEEAAQAVSLDITWRRHDENPDERQFIIIEAESGDTLPNIHRVEVTNEKCALVFGPVEKPGTYYFYYLPYIVKEDWGFYGHDYPGRETPASIEWMAVNELDDASKLQRLPVAELSAIEARTAFDSFYPMEVIALADEKEQLLSKFDQDFLLFPESREYPIRMQDEIPLKWIESGPSNVFSGKAQKNEYYAFQIGLFASESAIENVKVKFFPLESGENKIAAYKLTCFNTGGTDPYGKIFEKRVDVPIGNVQPLWIGVDIPKQIAPGTYKGSMTITAENAAEQTVALRLSIGNETLADRGDSESWRHSRLRWLNSKLGIDDKPTAPYKSIGVVSDFTFNLSGKQIELSENIMPRSINIYGTEILESPIAFVVETGKGINTFGPAENIQPQKEASGVQSASWESFSDDLIMKGLGVMEADGYLNFTISLQSLNDVELKDVRLEIPMKNRVARYMMGMGLPGTTVPRNHKAKWQGPHDSFWIGNEKGGIWCELRGSDYHGPLLNLYRPAFPESWNNDDKGGFRIEQNSNRTKAVVYSGKRALKAGESIEFEWSLLMTPVKKIDYQSQFLDRYFHNALEPIPPDEDLERGIKIVNLHHANEYNPHINYPFIAVDEMKNFVNDMHAKGQKVKIYYTIRELTNYTTELWALRSLGHEILGDGKGGGYPWLQEHLVEGYRPQWYQYLEGKSPDASIVNAPGDSRWYNYYIEGLAWLVRNVDIDGLYLDDVTYDRRTVKRIRKVLDNEKPGCLLDLHSNTGFSKGPATQYTEYFPFIDKIWFGESFKYSEMPPENWLVEVSGIPFGHMGDMLHGGGNRWLGMLFGMTVRHPWLTEGVTCDPRPVWGIWDSFGIHEAKMVGFWEEEPLLTTNNPKVKATAYLKDGKMLISLGNFSDVNQKVKLSIDWAATGIDKALVNFVAPEIKDFQAAVEFTEGESISIEPRKGWLIIVE